MRGKLSKKKMREIDQVLPSIDDRLRLATVPGSGFAVAIQDLASGGSLSVALVCLNDAVSRFGQIRLALFEAYACLAWYREISPKAPRDFEAIFTANFYVDHAALLLYAAAEDISYFIIHFMGIGDELKQYVQDPKVKEFMERSKISSNAAKVGVYLKEKYPEKDITKIVLGLNGSTSWKEAIRYRNDWVHDKPPIIEGLGIQHDRKSKIIESEGGARRMYFGGGSLHKYTIDKLLTVGLEASTALSSTLSSLLQIVLQKRTELGEIIHTDGVELKLSIIRTELTNEDKQY